MAQSQPTFDHEQVVVVHSDGEETCPMCNWGVTNRFRLESESVAVCGDCFGTWLQAEDAEITIE